MEYKRLEQSLIDIVKEEQAKLGYRKHIFPLRMPPPYHRQKLSPME